MAIETALKLTDDLDGTVGGTVKTRRIAFDREIELSDENYAQILTNLGELLAKSRETVRRPGNAQKRKPVNQAERTYHRKVKTWAKENGHQVPDRGRPGQAVIGAYVAATGDVR